MERQLNMVFKTEEGKKVSLRVAAAREGLDALEVKEAMDLIISKNIIKTTAGDLIAVDSAHLVETSSTEFELSEI